MLTKDDIGTLIAADFPYAVSIFLPTHIAGREIRQDPIRLKNLLDEAERQLVEGGLRSADAEALLAPAVALVEDYEFWRRQEKGLALFLAPDVFHCHKVPIELPEMATVGRRFHVKPLLPMVAADGMFFLLTVTADRARLFEGSRFGIVERDAGLPAGVDTIYGETDYENMIHQNPASRPRTGRPTTVVQSHNFGESPEELRKAQLIEYVRRIAGALEDHLGGSQAPLILAAEPEIEGQFRNLNRSKALVPQGLGVNPDTLNEEELHRRAYAIVEPLFTQARDEAIGHFQSLCGNADQRATTKVEEIVKAARFGRIDTLFLAADETVWGRYDETADEVAIHDSALREDEDLLDYAAAQTLLQGGRVDLMDKKDLPRGEFAAAILRY